MARQPVKDKSLKYASLFIRSATAPPRRALEILAGGLFFLMIILASLLFVQRCASSVLGGDEPCPCCPGEAAPPCEGKVVGP